jgi:hypothetical protein
MWSFFNTNLYNNSVGADPFYAQTSGPRPPKILQA